jgi:hypothetical protein
MNFLYVIILLFSSASPQILPGLTFVRDPGTGAIIKVKSTNKFKQFQSNFQTDSFDSLLDFEISLYRDSFHINLWPISLHYFEGEPPIWYNEEYVIPRDNQSIAEYEKFVKFKEIEDEKCKAHLDSCLLRIKGNFDGRLNYHDPKKDVEKKLGILLQYPQQGRFGCAYSFKGKILIFGTCRVPLLIDVVDSLP